MKNSLLGLQIHFQGYTGYMIDMDRILFFFFHVTSLLVNGQNNEPTKPCMFLYLLPVTRSYIPSYLILRTTLNINNLGTLNSQMTWVEFNSWDLQQSVEITPVCDFLNCLSQGHRLSMWQKQSWNTRVLSPSNSANAHLL